MHVLYEKSGCVLFPPVAKFLKVRDVNFTRKQFPLQLAFVITIHKSQGLTLDRAVVDIGDKETSIGLTCVELSKVKSLEGLAFNIKFYYDSYNSIKKSLMLGCRKREELRMKHLAFENF